MHKRIGEMLAVDCQPLSMAEDVGFKRVLQSLEPCYKCPSRKYFTDIIILKIYTGMKEAVSKLIGEAKHLVLPQIYGAVVLNNSFVKFNSSLD